MKPDTDSENRNTHRYPRNESIMIEVMTPEGERRQLHTQTLDHSEDGIKVRLAEALPLVSGIALTIEPLDRDTRYRLQGEVRWCRRLLDSLYEAGILIIEDDSEDYQRWQEYLTG